MKNFICCACLHQIGVEVIRVLFYFEGSTWIGMVFYLFLHTISYYLSYLHNIYWDSFIINYLLFLINFYALSSNMKYWIVCLVWFLCIFNMFNTLMMPRSVIPTNGIGRVFNVNAFLRMHISYNCSTTILPILHRNGKSTTSWKFNSNDHTSIYDDKLHRDQREMH